MLQTTQRPALSTEVTAAGSLLCSHTTQTFRPILENLLTFEAQQFTGEVLRDVIAEKDKEKDFEFIWGSNTC